MEIWRKLYQRATEVQNPRALSNTIEAGGVAAAILTDKGNIYVGVCIDTACSLGMCAERAAIAAMITAGESHIERVVAVMGDGRLGEPCGACIEMMMQLGCNQAQVLLDLDGMKAVALDSLMPQWWGRGKK